MIDVPSDLADSFEITRSGLERLGEASLVIAASGTVTLQCAVSGTPMVVIYKTSPATFFMGKRLVKIPWIAMPNVLAGEEIVPELIQGEATPGRVASTAAALLGDGDRFRLTSEKLLRLRGSLSGRGGSRLVAEVALAMARGERAAGILRSIDEGRSPERVEATHKGEDAR